MKMLKLTLLALTFSVLVGATCNSRPPPIPIEPTDTANCSTSCEHLQKLGCDEGKPLEDGTTCTKFCEDTHKNGFGLNPTCVMGIKECSEINPCMGSL